MPALLTTGLLRIPCQRLSAYLSHRASVFGKCASSPLAVLPYLPREFPALSLEPATTFPDEMPGKTMLVFLQCPPIVVLDV